MIKVPVRLKDQKDAECFSKILCRYPYNADLKIGKSEIDPKSILGLIAVAMDKPAVLLIHIDSADELLSEIKPFIISKDNS